MSQMDIEQLQKAQQLITKASEYINTERLLLMGLKESLEEYQEFLRRQMRVNRGIPKRINVKTNYSSD